MTSQALLVFVFILGFGSGILTLHLHVRTFTQDYDIEQITFQTTSQDHGINLDPFPLPPCTPNRTSAVYVFYGSQNSNNLLTSIDSLIKSNFPGRVRIIVDEKANSTLVKSNLPEKYLHLLPKIDFLVLPLPDLKGKELIPHSNKIRALQAGSFVYENDSTECTLSLDTDTYINPRAPWNNLLSTLQMHDFAVAKDCSVGIENVPDYLRTWMPNTGVLAMRNTPRTRLVLNDWLKHFVPCNGTHVSTCTPGTDQYPFLQLTAKHAVRLYKLDNSWNCRVPGEIKKIFKKFPVYSMSVLSNRRDPGEEDAKISPTCGGLEDCHILHGHFLKYFN
ncbi:MAG: hypothetical protein ACI90V_005141 [Bacillariaceae sp.]|jgi:hypothetical protein